MSTLLQAVMDVACQVNQVLKVQAESQVSQESQELQVLQVTQESHQLLLVSQQLHHHASLAHKDLQDHQDHQEAQETQERLEHQDALEPTLLQAAQDHVDLQDLLVNQAQLDLTENQVYQHNPNHWFQESQARLETKDQLDHPDLQDLLVKMALQDLLDQRESQDQMEHLDRTDNQDPLDHLEVLALKERRVFARNTVLSTAVSSSRTEQDDKRMEMERRLESRQYIYLLPFLLLPFLPKTY